ncbi:ABC transporter permease [Nocardia caishijiensis]|uniref:NitT/TauT family transport system permease protein/sulfonate transport system permease protein n=1 Tax=Nocardia caishijiensis TaxID=184756 RepID=A0ABQ6YH41_9NOCA|nr:ABC transporter permease [Nocardia caishijiensis]KAF0844819.1 NitT/TauT family transport system permease protein/sulfonate transport system permease protein [Nocardia caishijiensis]
MTTGVGTATAVDPATTKRRPRRGTGTPIWVGRSKTLGWTVVGLGLAALGWTLVAASGRFPAELFPALPQVARAGYGLWLDGLLADDIVASVRRAATGFGIGALAGIVAAVLTVTTATGRRLLQPVLRLLAPVPTIGLVPLAILWFGLGEDSKALVIALGVFVPVWINSHTGLSSTPQDYLQAARCLGAGRRQTLLEIVLPEAAPDIVSGLRVGAAMSFVLIVVAEMTGTTAGIGYRIYQSQMFSQADRVIACLIVLGIIGAVCDLVIASSTAPLTKWSEREH